MRIWKQPFNSREYALMEEALKQVQGVDEHERKELEEKVNREKVSQEYYDALFGKE